MDKDNPTGTGSFSMYGTGWFQESLRVGGTSPLASSAKNVLLEGDALKLDNIHISLPYLGAGQWSNIAYGNDKFVAVGGGGYNSNVAAYSKDGNTWIKTTIPNYQWQSVTYGDGKFIAVGGKGTQGMSSCAAYSEDGINWIELDVFGNRLYSIVYENGKFVAVGYEGAIIYSEDGMNWRSPTVTLNRNSWSSVAYGDGKFVAVGFGVNGATTQYAIYSTNGIDWIQTNLPDLNCWESVAYGDGKFVAIGRGRVSTMSNIAAYSEDGLNWIRITLPSANHWTYITYGKRKFIVRNSNLDGVEDAMLYSEDGINWNPINVSGVNNCDSLSYFSNKFMMIYRDYPNPFIVYSYDGLTWYDTYEAFTQNNKDITNKVRDLVLPISSAQVGQTVVVKSVDDNGKPNEWKTVELPSVDGLATEEFVNTSIANKVTVPQNAVMGDLLTYDGSNWVRISKADLISDILLAIEESNKITFYIESEEYRADKNMTWHDWCNSNYNTSNFGNYYEDERVSDADDHIIYEDEFVHGSDIIIANYGYTVRFDPTTEV